MISRLLRLNLLDNYFLDSLGLQLAQFNNPRLNEKLKTRDMTTLNLRKSINRPPFAARFSCRSPCARAGLVCAFANGSGTTAVAVAGRRLYRWQHR